MDGLARRAGWKRACGWAAAGGLALALQAQASAVEAEPVQTYRFDQQTASVRFAFSVAGMLKPSGAFERFSGELRIDPDRPADSRVAIELDSDSVHVPLPGGSRRLQSPDYFDADAFPSISFRSTHIVPQPSGHLVIEGVLSLRGIERIQTFDAVRVPEAGVGAAPLYVIRGDIDRASFGMVSDRPLVSDTIALTMRVRLEPAPGG